MTDQLPLADGVSQFLDKYKSARGVNAKELRLTIAEAERLVLGIATMQDRYNKLSDQVIDLQNQLLEPQEQILSGGSFE